MGARSWETELVLNGDGASVWEDGKDLEMDVVMVTKRRECA